MLAKSDGAKGADVTSNNRSTEDATWSKDANRRHRLRSSAATLTKVLYVVATFVVVVVVWQAAVTVFHVSSVILPSPVEVVQALDTAKHIILEALGWTMYATLIGFAIAVVAGVACALLVSEVALLRKTLYPLIVSFQSMPHIGLAPLLVIWFGFGTASHAALASLVAFFPIFSNMAHGLDTVRGERVRLFESYGASRLETMWKLKLPMSLPFLFAGLSVGIIFSMLGVIVAEFLGSNQGMGYLLVQQSNNLDTPGVFAVLVALAVVGLLLHVIVGGVRHITLRWL